MKSDQLLACLSSWLNQCLMRRAPQDDPLSWSAMSWALAAYLVTDLLQARSSSGWSMSLAMTLVDTLVMVLFARVVLLVVKKTARFVQTLTSLAGTGAILYRQGLVPACLWPVCIWRWSSACSGRFSPRFRLSGYRAAFMT
jgi:hypothetical protein